MVALAGEPRELTAGHSHSVFLLQAAQVTGKLDPAPTAPRPPRPQKSLLGYPNVGRGFQSLVSQGRVRQSAKRRCRLPNHIYIRSKRRFIPLPLMLHPCHESDELRIFSQIVQVRILLEERITREAVVICDL